MRVGILTSGGDCQALNATMRGLAKALYQQRKDIEIIGFLKGYQGLMYEKYKKMSLSDFEDILNVQRKEAANIVEKEGIIKKEGIEELLGYLENKGIKKAVASSSFRPKVNKFLTITGLIDKFDYIVAGDEVKDSKPAPDLYLNVIEKFGIDNQNIIILEDSKNGLTAAKRAGLEKRIYIPDIVILSSEEEKKLTYKKFNSLLEVKKELEENNNFI